MKKSFLYSLLIAFIITSFSFAQKRNFDGPNFEGKRWSNLELTSDQKTKIKQLHLDHQKEMVDKHAELKKLRLEIKGELNKEEIDRNRILNLSNKISDMKKEFNSERIKIWFKTYDMLNDTQKEKFKEHFPVMDGKKEKHHKGKRLENKQMRNRAK